MFSNNEEKLSYYESLLNNTYKELVSYLLHKYGIVIDDYFKEKSYNRFLNGEIKDPGKGKYSRTAEGLLCHHVAENAYENISNSSYIANFKYPFDLQKKENLVYCDLVEHLILHIVIMKETNNQFGIKGVKTYLAPTIEDYYINGAEPTRAWEQSVKEKAFLTKENAIHLFDTIEEYLQ